MGVASTGIVVLDPSIRLVVARSERFLNTASTALANGDPESAASRAYYALYHMTVLLLRVVRGIERDRWDHDQLQKAFLDEFCKLHFRFSRDDGREWGDVMDTRFTADYGRASLNRRHALRSLERAERLVAKMRREVGGDA
jgi:uncharacterized protein (UPF0332 family)